MYRAKSARSFKRQRAAKAVRIFALREESHERTKQPSRAGQGHR